MRPIIGVHPDNMYRPGIAVLSGSPSRDLIVFRWKSSRLLTSLFVSLINSIP